MSYEKYKHWVATGTIGRTPLDEAFLKLWTACREWKPISESLGNEPPDDPITWALKELEETAEVALADLPTPGEGAER